MIVCRSSIVEILHNTHSSELRSIGPICGASGSTFIGNEHERLCKRYCSHRAGLRSKILTTKGGAAFYITSAQMQREKALALRKPQSFTNPRMVAGSYLKAYVLLISTYCRKPGFTKSTFFCINL